MVIWKMAVMKNVPVYLALLTFVLLGACAKDSVETPVQTVIRLNISVDSPDQADSKAVKNEWAAGDKINIWFDANGGNQTVPDFVISYDGTSWSGSSFREGCTLKPSGFLMAIYESHNDLSAGKYAYNWDSFRQWFYPTPSLESTDYRCMPMLLSCESIPYTFTQGTITFTEGQLTYTESTLTANLTGWIFQTRFKVLLKNDNAGLTLSADNYVLQVYNATADSYPLQSSAWVLIPRSFCPTMDTVSGNAVGKTAGVQEDDGIAFYYNSFSATSADIVFTLWANGGSVSEYNVYGKTLDATGNGCKGVALKHSSFAAKGNIDPVPVEDWGLLN